MNDEDYDINDLVSVMQQKINDLTTQNILLETKLLKLKNDSNNTDKTKKVGNTK
jgi:hypothetical protein